MATQEFEGKPCSIGTRNWRHPDQWPMSSIMQIRLKMRMNTPRELMNCEVGLDSCYTRVRYFDIKPYM